MTWIKQDDKLHRNPKARESSDGAFKVWVLSWSYCGDMPDPTGFMTRQEAEGFVRSLKKPITVISELVSRRMWDEVEGGFVVHEFEQGLPKTSTPRVRKFREAKRKQGVSSNDLEAFHAVSPPARAVPEPDPVPVPDTRGDIASVGANGASPSPSPSPSPQVQVIRLLDWFMAKRGWSTWESPEVQKREAQQAVAIVELGVPFTHLIAALDLMWSGTDPDDRPSSLKYFWTRLQDEQHAAMKYDRSHASSDLTKLDVAAPVMRRSSRQKEGD